jgi:hypothetical protein
MRRRTARAAPRAPAAAVPSPAEEPSAAAHPLLGLQRAAGNRAVDRALHAPGERDGETHPPSPEPAGGEPLAAPLRAFFGGRFGHDLGGVRVHRGAEAEHAAAAVDAAAYAVGSHVVFGRGQYAPETAAGRRLIGHELAHVVQQRPGGRTEGAAETPALERAADRASHAAAPGGGRVAVEGRAPAGMARTPRSLSGSIDIKSATKEELEEEILEIREWLAAQGPTSSDEANLLRSVLHALETRLAQVASGAASWIDFAPDFNREFAATLHAFVVPGTAPAAAGPLPPGASGPGLTPGQLKALFTPRQRDRLKDFIDTRFIPQGLFNADEKGTTTAQQRLLLSAHILAKGKYRPGSFDQRVHARMCWHWAQNVHHYAGATPSGSSLSTGVMGGFDIHGGAVMGTGWHKDIYNTGAKGRVARPDLPAEEQSGGVGPLHAGTEHARAAEEAEAEAPGVTTTGIPYHRKPALPFERFGEVQAGDWIYVYNGNGSLSGGHSEIFSHFTSEEKTSAKGIRYRDAVVYSQPTSKSGGRRETERLGERFSPSERILTITYVGRVSPDAAPATEAAEVLPGGRAAEKMSAANERFIAARERALRAKVDRGLLKAWFRERNEGFIDALDPHLTDDQEAMLDKANAEGELEGLVHLYQRLGRLSANAVILDRNMEATYARLDPLHAEIQVKVTEAQEAADKELAAIDLELGTVRTDVQARTARRAALDVEPEIKRLRREWAALGPRIAKAPRGAARDALKAERQKKLDEIAALRVLKGERREERAALRAELGTLATRKRRLEAKRGKIARDRAAAARALPYGLVHPGRLDGQIKGNATGRLADLDPGPVWTTLIVPGSTLPPPAPRPPSRRRKP